MATLKPTTPLRAPNKGPLKPTSPLHPNTAPKTPISHPHRRQRFQSHTSTSEQRQWRFQTTAHLADRARRRHPWVAAGPGRASRRRTKPHTSTPGAAGVEGAGGTGGPGRGARGRRRGLAGLRGDAQSHTSATRPHWCGGRRRDRRARAGFEARDERSEALASRAAGPSGARNTSGATSHNQGKQKPQTPKDLRFHRARGGS